VRFSQRKDNQYYQPTLAGPSGGASMQDLYGISGLPNTSELTGGLNTQNIGGFTSVIGRQATNPQFQNPTTVDPKVNFSWMKGRHALKMGAEFQIVHTEVMDINPVYGLMGYSGQFSKPSSSARTPAAASVISERDGTPSLARDSST
jgi:hypothetical protein